MYLLRAFIGIREVFKSYLSSKHVSSYQAIVFRYKLKEEYVKLLKLIYVCMAMSPRSYFMLANVQ